MTANGILLNKNPIYCLSSFRYFRKNEKHITRIAGEHILLIVFQGTLRFVENGIPIEINENEYYIQKRGLYQEGAFASNAPKYFYLHFQGDWGSSAPFLPYRGTCLIEPLMPLLEQMTGSRAHKRSLCYKKRNFLHDSFTPLHHAAKRRRFHIG